MRKVAFVSRRSDRRGHYPVGRRRSTLTQARHRRAVRYLKHILGLGYSLNQIGKVIEVNPRTIGRWLSGRKCWPSDTSADQLLGFGRTVRKAGIRPQGRPRRIRYSKNKRLKYVSQIKALRKRSLSFAAITRTLKGPAQRTVHRWYAIHRGQGS